MQAFVVVYIISADKSTLKYMKQFKIKLFMMQYI